MDSPELRGFSAAVGQALKSQREEFEARAAALEARITRLEAVLGVLLAPDATAAPPVDAVPRARH